MEQLNLGNEAVKSSKRRLSSILKATRTSMKIHGAEQEEQKEEIVKPVEKKRNSRRVSFATTNNVRVFTNDAKSESPVLASIQNTQVGGDRPNEKILCFVDEGSHQIKGLDTLLNTPLYLSQHKENFFSDPVLQDDCVDRTMLLGDDTGCMDITQSHTITIDKDYEFEEETNPSQKGLPHEAKAERKNAANDSDFSAFLASMSLPTVNTIKPHSSENQLGNIFCSANTSTSDVDKENHLPVKQHPGGKGNPQQPRGLQRRRSRIGIVEENGIETTKSHTVVTENIGNAELFTPSVSVNQRGVSFMTSAFSNIPDDMELTLSQTAAINVKVTGNIICDVQAPLEHNRSHNFSEDSDTMEVTRAFNVSVREKDYTMSMKEQAQSSVPTVRRMSSFNMIGNAETADHNKAGHLQTNFSIAQTTNSDDMEMTGTFDVSVREKDTTSEPAHPPGAKVSKMSTFDSFENVDMVDRNKSTNNFIAPTATTDDMEMTQCHTIVLNDKQTSENQQFSNTRNSLPLVPLSRSIREDQHTGNMKKDVPHPVPRVSKMPCFDLVGGGLIMNPIKSDHLPIAQIANSDEMEITQCQTIFLEAEQVNGDKPFSNTRNSLPLVPLSRSVREDRHTGNIKNEALHPVSRVNKMPCFDLVGEELIMNPIKSDHLSITQTANSDEMEMTQCQTIFLDAKQVNGDKPLNNSRKNWPGTSVSGPDCSDGMDMTQAFTGRIIHNAFPASKKKRGQSILMPATTTLAQHNDSDCIDFTCQTNTYDSISTPSPDEMEDDMDMTQCQTVVLEAENCKKAKLFSNSRKSLNLVSTSFSPDVDSMEITQALTGNIVLKSFASREESKHERNLLPVAQSCQIQDESDCMEMTCQASASNLAIPCVDDEMELTGCNTIAIDSKNTLAASATEIKVHDSALWASTSVSRSAVSSEEQNVVSEPAKCAINHVFPSKHFFDLNGKNIKCNNTETISCGPAIMQLEKNCKMAHPSNVLTDEDSDMQVTKVLTMPIEIEQSVSFNEEAQIKTFCGSGKEEGQAPWPNKEQSTGSVQLEGSSSNESAVDSFIIEEQQHAKARRRSLADFQTELRNMSRRIQEEQNVITGSTTAPLPSCCLPENSLKEQCEISKELTSNATPKVKQINKSVHEKTTPFSLKKTAFSSRLSLCGIVPKLPKRATTATPNKTVTISSYDLQSLQLEKHFDVAVKNGNCETVNINDEEFPEMSSEEDLSKSLENWPNNKEDELDGSLVVPKYEEPLENEVFETDTSASPCFKRPHSEEDSITAEQTKKVCVSDMGPDCHEAAVQWEGNFTRHAAQNPRAKTIEDTGVSESTLKYSQFDCHMDGTLNQVFDFNKKLEDGSITVNEFLSHFGINFVIHRSRPSALPDSCRAGETRTMEDLLKEKYIYHPKQRAYEQDCKNLTEMVERLKEQMPEQEKSLGCINGALQQELCTLSEEQLKSFGSKLKERRVYFGKRSKALSHEMKRDIYSELIKTTQDAKQSLISKIKETNEMIEDLDGCINDLETELASVEAMIMGDHLDAPQTRPALKAKEEDLQRLNSVVTEKEREIGELDIQLRSLESQQEKLQGESSSLKNHLATLNSLNEWRLDATDEKGALFTFLHKTVHLQVNLLTPAGKEWMTEDVERNIDVSFQLHLDVEKSESHASMVHKLLSLHYHFQTQWTKRYPTTQHIPELLHDISLVVGRLRLLGEEIHRLKKWGLKLRILKISCSDTQVHVIFSSLKAFEKFELSLMVTPDYPFGPLHIQDFKSYVGDTRLSQIEDIISSVKPAKNYLTKVLKNIHDDLLC
ncbi:kinetochore scaffold 1 isoform X2 [Puntigrus tetrazona]|uniref:kinetochore scaffold 1 isoform X2 n=1 Tax=Puntigrus tetrazona TaxID=1606681 RepID=UPI001C8ACF3F|nr:kinetochore scaffold 1 isoform X2 [Puntigrus tetrazona]